MKRSICNRAELSFLMRRLRRPETLHFYLHAQFDDALGRQPEERRGADGISRHQHEQLLAPDGHAFTSRDDDRLAPEEVDDIVGVDVEPQIRGRNSASGTLGSSMNP